jgi:5-deoxy-glucuronate isomerase
MSYRGTHLGLELPRLRSGETTTFAAPDDEEAVLVLLAGEVEWGRSRVSRKDVFDTPASAVYLPPGTAIGVTAHEDTDLALITTVDCHLEAGGEPTFVTPEDVTINRRGKPGWQRDVHDVVNDQVAAQQLIVGETFNEPGQWSSYPPHKHDGTNGEPALEEVYYYRFDQPSGFGFQGLYDESGNERAVFLRHGAIVGIPRGYHPVCAAPGYRLYYLWALVGRPRQLAMYEDPAHRWL